MNQKLKVYFIRHGQTYFNVLKVLQGWSDTPLTAKGHEDAYELGKNLHELGDFSDNIYCSDVNRAVQTAMEISKGVMEGGRPPMKIHPLPELREQFYGSFEGKSKEKTYLAIDGKSIKETLKVMNMDDMQDRIADMDPLDLAENSHQFWSRFTKGMMQVIHENPSADSVIVITHSCILGALLGDYAPEMLDPVEPDNLSITTVEFDRSGFNPTVLAYNQHIEVKKTDQV